FLGFSMLVPVGSYLVLKARGGGRPPLPEPSSSPGGSKPPLPDTRGGYPVITLLLLLALGWRFIPALDNHRVRTLPEGAPKGKAVPLESALGPWKRDPRKSGGKPNLVVVATAGGGLRAAYWTVTVLGAVQDRVRTFDKQLFAISGVSG